MTEKYLWGKLRNHVNGSQVKLFRVENKVSTAMPDIHYICDSIRTIGNNSGWIESKWTTNPGNKIKFENGQPEWLFNYCLWGGSAWVLVGHTYVRMSLYLGSDFWDPKASEVLCPEPRIELAMNSEGFSQLKKILQGRRII